MNLKLQIQMLRNNGQCLRWPPIFQNNYYITFDYSRQVFAVASHSNTESKMIPHLLFVVSTLYVQLHAVRI